LRRTLPLFVLPAILAIAVAIAPLVTGRDTIYLRDVLNTHLEMKVAQAEAMREGRVPLVDPYRAGGQPLAGNPNAVPFYPDNLLYLFGSVLWALNAHFWLHWLLAPFAMYWLAREWELEPEAAWAAGVVYATSGYFVSQLTFLNLVAVTALAPALVASALAALRSRWGAAACGALWALTLLGGEPAMAGLALLLALAALLVRRAERPELGSRRALGRLAVGLLLGSLAAAPQLVELARILPLSFRGHRGYTVEAVTTQSFDPRQALEWLVPFPFGRPDRLGLGGLWGERFYGGSPPYFLSLYPGLFALALVLAAGRPRRAAERWAWGAVVAGLFLALGGFNPLLRWLFEWPAMRAFRYPVKFWLLVAVGASLIAAMAFDRALVRGEPARRRALGGALLGLGTLLGVGWILASIVGEAGFALLRAFVPERFGDPFVAHEQLRWAGSLLLSSLLLGLYGAIVAGLRKRPLPGAALLLALHAVTQVWILRPALPTDAAAPYLAPSPLLEAVPPSSLSAHGALTGLFRHSTLREGVYPDERALWLERRAFEELYPFAGALWGRRFELNVSPEGLDSFLTRLARAAVEQSEDPDRLRLMAAWGIDRLILDRELQPEARAQAELLRQVESFGQPVYAYRLIAATPEVSFRGTVLEAPSVAEGLLMLRSPDFDPARMVVLAGRAARITPGGAGAVRVLRRDAETLEAEVEAASSGVLHWQRAHLSIYRATIDGAPAAIEAANVHRIGVRVGPGRHAVRVWADHAPTRWGLGAGFAGWLALGVLGWRSRGRPRLG
jgi:hypothetical protein